MAGDAMIDESVDAQLEVRRDHYCFGCGRENPHGLKLTFYVAQDGGVWAPWTPVRENEGFAGIAHGGIITTVLDEVMGWAVSHRKIWAVTGTLNVRFRKPVVIGEPARASARVVSEHGRKIQVTSELRSTEGERLLADAEAIFIRVPEAQARAWQSRYFDPAAGPRTDDAG
jgi:uncharacterized protein (TIGR00369 family)